MLKQEAMTSSIAMHEIELEITVLSKIRHDNIINIYGYGSMPRPFIVIEQLDEGSLYATLSKEQSRIALARKLFKRKSFTYLNLLKRAKEIAIAMDYLHFGISPDVTVIHRGKAIYMLLY